jgi:hypothetical protein
MGGGAFGDADTDAFFLRAALVEADTDTFLWRATVFFSIPCAALAKCLRAMQAFVPNCMRKISLSTRFTYWHFFRGEACATLHGNHDVNRK